MVVNDIGVETVDLSLYSYLQAQSYYLSHTVLRCQGSEMERQRDLFILLLFLGRNNLHNGRSFITGGGGQEIWEEEERVSTNEMWSKAIHVAFSLHP